MNGKEGFIGRWRKEFGCQNDSGVCWCKICTALEVIWRHDEKSAAACEEPREVAEIARKIPRIDVIYCFDLGKMPLCTEEYNEIFGFLYDDGREPAFSDILVYTDKSSNGHYFLSVKNPTVEMADTLFIEVMGNRYPMSKVKLEYQRPR